jgi:5-methoxy-6-methylbenzimidazole methyltransferase
MKIVIVENPRPVTLEHCNDVANAPLSACLNSGSALAVARLMGWETAYLDFTTCQDDARSIAAVIGAENAHLVLFHWVYSWGHEETVWNVLELLKREGFGVLGAFGLFPTLSRDKLSCYAPQLDFIIVGELEQTLEVILQQLHVGGGLTALPGVYRKNEPFCAREVISDLSRLPVPDDVGANRAFTTLNIAASRGCFGDCSFCFINRFYGCSIRRERDIASLAHELETRLRRRDVSHLYFTDPTFIGYGAGQKERVKAISELVKNVGIPFGFETRVDTVNGELMNLLVENGADSVFLGIESGCDSVLKRINKRINTRQIIRAVRSIRESGIRLTVGFIMFEPDSTLDELRENYAFLEGLELLNEHDLTVNMLYHSQIVLHGSRAWDKFEREGRLLVDETLPFEAHYTFRDPAVARVSAGMRRMATEYFLLMNEIFANRGDDASGCGSTGYTAGFNGDDINLLLKDAFRAFVSAAGADNGIRCWWLEEKYLEGLRRCFR